MIFPLLFKIFYGRDPSAGASEWVGLSIPSPRHKAHTQNLHLRAFHFYPSRNNKHIQYGY